ncbi:MAG: hypothetical protein JRI74_05160 [Deltaproteobacteria bacterium]|nr:hypothetical protein [Deltaproteobacteria bacterium]
MKSANCLLILIPFFLLTYTGCATYRAQEIIPTPIDQAEQDIPEEQLLDVGILVFESEELSEEDAEAEGTNPQIRKAEGHFMPYHLKNTLQQSSHWGAVQVIPSETASVDLKVKGRIHKSNGEHLMVEIDVADATGRTWLNKTYIAEATEYSYLENKPGEKDAFQDLYDTIANDMAAFKDGLTPSDIESIRMVSKLKFAEDYAPHAFDGYLKKNEDDIRAINRLPADDDPMMERLLKVREREYMYVDVLNQYYEVFYNEMWPSYENWRKLSLTEQQAIKKIKRDALTRKILGALVIAGAILAGSGDSDTVGSLVPAMVIIGGQVIISGFNVSKEAQIHASAIKELSESFGNEMEPVVMEFQGQQYELTGSAEEQYNHWRELLHKIYIAETGFDQDVPPLNEQVNETESP